MSRAASAVRKLMKKKERPKVAHGALLKTTIPAGLASAAPPLGPQLGERGLNAAQFAKDFNKKTEHIVEGVPIPTRVHIKPDRTYTIELCAPPIPWLLKQAAGITKGGFSNSDTAGMVTLKHVFEIAKVKQQEPVYLGVSLRQMCQTVMFYAQSCKIKVVRDIDPVEYHEFLKKREELVIKEMEELQNKRQAKIYRIFSNIEMDNGSMLTRIFKMRSQQTIRRVEERKGTNCENLHSSQNLKFLPVKKFPEIEEPKKPTTAWSRCYSNGPMRPLNNNISQHPDLSFQTNQANVAQDASAFQHAQHCCQQAKLAESSGRQCGTGGRGQLPAGQLRMEQFCSVGPGMSGGCWAPAEKRSRQTNVNGGIQCATARSSARQLTLNATIRDVFEWHRYQNQHLCLLFDIYAVLESEPLLNKFGGYQFDLRDQTGILQATYYPIDGEMIKAKMGDWLRVTGVVRFWGFQATFVKHAEQNFLKGLREKIAASKRSLFYRVEEN
ncbi:39S ribosomal protein L11, mitochondrial [Trichinella papuae]|uniref:Large ribosomal subunit protein uL11m n=1 Tax=Trichinella papuae TaxID=268474 RepID=A0A0V1MW40_9BILA|nr:39S ribosomal protein L11, mitochondrial [Trichinella papuae]